jgi:hypothetical protein
VSRMDLGLKIREKDRFRDGAPLKIARHNIKRKIVKELLASTNRKNRVELDQLP